jgi:hypothetical protein
MNPYRRFKVRSLGPQKKFQIHRKKLFARKVQKVFRRNISCPLDEVKKPSISGIKIYKRNANGSSLKAQKEREQVTLIAPMKTPHYFHKLDHWFSEPVY